MLDSQGKVGNYNEIYGVWASPLWLSLPALLNPLPTQPIHFKCSICSLELHEGIPGKKEELDRERVETRVTTAYFCQVPLLYFRLGLFMRPLCQVISNVSLRL